MKNKESYPEIMLPEGTSELCGFNGEDSLELHASEGTLIILKESMTAIEVVRIIETLSEAASELTVTLAKACGICNNCGDKNPEPCESCDGNEVCAFLNGCKDGPAEWVANCSLCRDLLDDSQDVRVPDYVLEEAGISKDAKLEAYADEGSGEITVTEAEDCWDITDVPPGLLMVLAQSGVCLAELDELIMLEETVYGR